MKTLADVTIVPGCWVADAATSRRVGIIQKISYWLCPGDRKIPLDSFEIFDAEAFNRWRDFQGKHPSFPITDENFFVTVHFGNGFQWVKVYSGEEIFAPAIQIVTRREFWNRYIAIVELHEKCSPPRT